MYLCRHYKIEELVCRELLLKFKNSGKSASFFWQLFCKDLLRSADYIRDIYGACYVNSEGITNAGLRAHDSATGAAYSAHKFARALDIHILSIDTKFLGKERILEYNKVRQALILDKNLSCLNFENNVSWLHIDTFNRKERIFEP